jgi:malate synthase
MSAIEVTGYPVDRADEVLTADALDLVERLHRAFEPERLALLEARAKRQGAIDGGELPGFLPETVDIRSSEWQVSPFPADLADRRVEITGPVERKMMINALNSGAKVFMADFEDALSPTWQNVIEGQVNLVDAWDRTLALDTAEKSYRLGEELATLLVRPRGWHLTERHVEVDGLPVSASLFDYGIYVANCAWRAVERGSGPYFYLPKLESHLEARLWNDVFLAAQDALGLPAGTVKATVLIETVLAAFEMDEILWELREHSAGLNAGRWDFIFSVIKKFRNLDGFVLPDRAQVTMTVPFMRAYTELLVKTCHRRGAHAIGGMAAFVPNRRDPEVTEQAIAKVRDDKRREAGDGCDGTWVAHPDLVPVAREVFDAVLGDRPNQLERQRPDVVADPAALVNFDVPGGTVTAEGLRTNVDVAIRYLASWLRGTGAAAIFNLMEDAATAEISRSQVWQWARSGVVTQEGAPITAERVMEVISEVTAALRLELGDDGYERGRFPEAEGLFTRVALADEFHEFLTLPAYDMID